MAGDTTNTDILNALNQLIKSVNDLETKLNTYDEWLICVCRSLQAEPEEERPGAYLPIIFKEGDTYLSRKCLAANGVFDEIAHIMSRGSIENWDSFTMTNLSLMTGLVAVAFAAGPVGWGAAILSAFLAMLVSAVITSAQFDMDDMQTVWQAQKNDIVLALFNSLSSTQAKSAISGLLEGQGLTEIEKGLFSVLLSNNILNKLFSNEPIPANYTPQNPVICPVGAVYEIPNPCDPPQPGIWKFGLPRLLDVAGNPVDGTVQAELAEGKHRIDFTLPGLAHCLAVPTPGTQDIEMTTYDCVSNPCDCPGVVQGSRELDGVRFTLYSDSPFSVAFTWSSYQSCGCV